jgi:EpsI family protein
MNLSDLRKPILLGLLMVAAAGLTIAATPTVRMADDDPKIDLEKVIPERFGEWQIDPSIVPVAVAADVQARLDKIYNQTLSRTYVGADGQRVMLSIAYGGDQSDAMQVHRPEVCYASQGFDVFANALGRVATDYGTLPVRRLVARSGTRNEPITYWIVVGDRVATGSLEQKLAQLRYGFTGKIPDGMLVRVSSISRDSRAYEVQDRFVRELLSAVSAEQRARIAGTFGT